MAGLGEEDREGERTMDTHGEERVVDAAEEVESLWGTLEELLLACAIIRYGTTSWDCIAKELHKRIMTTSNSKNENHCHENINKSISDTAFTPHHCKKKYIELKRRYINTTTGGGGSSDNVGRDGGGGEESAVNELSCMVDELKKLRVEELKQEVQHHDDSIVSLQLKVKRLEEERKKCLKEKAEREEEVVVANKSDLKSEPEGDQERSRDKLREPDRSAMEKETTVKSVSGERSDVQREDLSFNESNSTNNKGSEVENRTRKRAAMEDTKGEESESTFEPEGAGKDEPDRYGSLGRAKPVKTSSACGGGGGVTKLLANGSGKRRTGVEPRHTSRKGEAVSESNRGGDGEETRQQTQSSEVQSSSSLSRRNKRRAGGGGWKASGAVGSSSADDGLEEPISPAKRRSGVNSIPLFRFMEILRSHKHGSVFERRLPSQETEKYRTLIRQHMDLESVQSKLDKGTYSQCHLRYYRDLLLVFTNAIIFYRKRSAEHQAARELRKLVIKEIAQRTKQPKPEPTMKERKEQQHLDPVVKKPRSTSMIVCRRRVTDQSTNKKEEGDIKMESKRLEVKPEVEPKKADHSQVINKVDDPKGGPKKSSRQISPLGSRKNVVMNKKKSKETKREVRSKKKDSSSDDEEEEEEEEDMEETLEERQQKLLAGSKKKGAANFLERIKQNSPDTTNGEKKKKKKNHVEEPEKKRSDSKRGNSNSNNDYKKKKDSRREKVRETSGRRIVSEGRTSDRGRLERGGRPPKRKAAMMMSPPESPTTKRRRDSGGGGDSTRTRKKSGR